MRKLINLRDWVQFAQKFTHDESNVLEVWPVTYFASLFFF